MWYFRKINSAIKWIAWFGGRENTGGGESSSKVLADSTVRLIMNGEKRFQNEE